MSEKAIEAAAVLIEHLDDTDSAVAEIEVMEPETNSIVKCRFEVFDVIVDEEEVQARKKKMFNA